VLHFGVKRLRKHTLLNLIMLASLVAVAHACDLDICCMFCEEDYDPWIGDSGRVRFIPGGYQGSGGCESRSGLPELMLAAHSRETFHLDPEEPPLPDDLVVATPASHIFYAIHDDTADEVTVYARSPGFGILELHSDGDIWDQKRIGVANVSFVQYEAPSSVFAGGAFILGLSGVYGGSDPLFGSGFMQWTTTPAEALVLVTEIDSLFVFSPSAPGTVRLMGREREEGRTLIDHEITVDTPDSIDEFVIQIIYPPYEAVPTGSWLAPPVLVRAPAVFSTVLGARVMDGHVVPISHINIIWLTEGDSWIIDLSDDAGGPTPWMPEFTVRPSGETTLVADIPFLGESARFDLIVSSD